MNSLQIGQRIQRCREKMELTQEQLAEVAGLSVSSLAKIERGYRTPSMENFVNIANALNASSDELLSDVLHYGYKVKVSKLSDMLESLPKQESLRIIAVVEAMISSQG